ncbi:unnamed protein product [Bodo saltans]|uniref:Uncharacterized protein n=1 Tax=Bodo saltans TaxID=75058 RepID=A0A0S4IU05_BODSA|nr:unnamed protein product [Bodo saltans]|eukprot:CUG07613.1 unnamed protein product [Bodo saltans]
MSARATLSPTESTLNGAPSERGGAKKDASRSGGGAANAYFRHSLGNFVPDAKTYFSTCCGSNSNSNTAGSPVGGGIVRQAELFERSIAAFATNVYNAIGEETFPCYPAAVGGSGGGADEQQVAGLDGRPTSAGDPVKRMPLGFDVNDSLQMLLYDTPIAPQLETGGKSNRGRWGKSRDARRRAEDVLLPFAEAAYRRRIGSDAAATEPPSSSSSHASSR